MRISVRAQGTGTIKAGMLTWAWPLEALVFADGLRLRDGPGLFRSRRRRRRRVEGFLRLEGGFVLGGRPKTRP